MPITAARHVIAVPDLHRSLAYYRDVLDFTVVDIGDPGWRFFKKDAACIMAGECPDAIPPRDLGDHSYFAYFEIGGIDGYYERVRSAGARLRKPLRSEPWGMKEFAVCTIDGHRIMFGEEAS